MACPKLFAFALLTVAAGGQVQSTIADEPRGRDRPNRSARHERREHAERDDARIRAEYIAARGDFAAATAAALSSEELKNWVQGLSLDLRLRRAEEDLREAQFSLREGERQGRLETAEYQQLAARAAAIDQELARLRGAQAGGSAATDELSLPDGPTIRQWIEREMGEETTRLSVELSPRDLERRTKRLHRLTSLANIAGGLRLNSGSVTLAVPAGPTERPESTLGAAVEELPGSIAPAGATVSRPEPDADGLGPATTVPPELPPRRDLSPATSKTPVLGGPQLNGR